MLDKLFLCLLISQINCYIKQTDLITRLLDNELKANKYKFNIDSSSYKLIKGRTKTYFNTKYLNDESKIDIRESIKKYYDSYRRTDGSDMEVYHKNTELYFEFKKKNGSFESKRIADMQVINEPIVNFYSEPGNDTCFIYFTEHNRPTWRTVNLIYHLPRFDLFGLTVFKWTRNQANNDEIPVKIFAVGAYEYHILYNEKVIHDEIKSYKEIQNRELPYLGIFKVDMFGRIQDYNYGMFQFPILCAIDFESGYGDRLLTNIVDIYPDKVADDVAYFLLVQDSNRQAICHIDEKRLLKAKDAYINQRVLCHLNEEPRNQTTEKRDSVCELEQDLPLNPVLHKIELQNSYRKILVRSKFESPNMKRSILFLLDHRNSLVIYSFLIDSGSDTVNVEQGKLEVVKEKCFEGIFSLLNAETKHNEILDLLLDRDDNAILVITRLYVQKIAIESFCTVNSFSSCKHISVCNIGRNSSNCANSQVQKRDCLPLVKNDEIRMLSDPYLCPVDPTETRSTENTDTCLLTDTDYVRPEIKRNTKLCDENSCICRAEICLPGKCARNTYEQLKCPLASSKMKLENYLMNYKIEPIYVMILSAFLTLFFITFILIVFYCCFSISQTGKRRLNVSELSTIDLSKLELKDDK